MEYNRHPRGTFVKTHRPDLLQFNYIGWILRKVTHYAVRICISKSFDLKLEFVFLIDNIFFFSFNWRSFFGRIENVISYLPRSYYHNQPHLEFTESHRRNKHHKAPNDSTSWICGGHGTEKVSMKTGKISTVENKVSRLSKQSLFGRYLKLKKQLSNGRGNNDEKKLYSDVKAAATDYQVKKVLSNK